MRTEAKELVENQVQLLGRLTRDPEMRYTQSGTAVANFNVAVDRPGRRDEGGDSTQPKVDFFRVVAWEKQAEAVSQYLTKGSPVIVSGRLQTGSYQAQDGQTRHTVEVVASQVRFLETREQAEARQARSGGGGDEQRSTGGRANGGHAGTGRTQPPPADEGSPFGDEDDSEVPF